MDHWQPFWVVVQGDNLNLLTHSILQAADPANKVAMDQELLFLNRLIELLLEEEEEEAGEQPPAKRFKGNVGVEA